MWKVTPILLAATGNSGRRRAATTSVVSSSSSAAPLPGMTPYRLFCAVQRADPILQRKSPPGRVAVLINRFKRLSPQARGGLKRMLLTIKGMPPRKRADKYKELVLSRRRYEGFSVKKQHQSTTSNKSTSASSSSTVVKKKSSRSNNSNKKSVSASPASSTAASSIARGKRLARLHAMKTRANRIVIKRRRQASSSSTTKGAVGKSSSSSTKKKQKQPAASAPFADHMSFLLYRIRSNKIGPRDAAKLINELRRKFNKC